MSEEHLAGGQHSDLVKIAVHLAPSDWHSHAIETMWAQPVGEDRYAIQNVPFFAYELSFDDVVRAPLVAGQRVVQEIAERGGHSTYRVFLSDGVRADSEAFAVAWKPLNDLGVTFEQANARLLAVDIPVSADIYAVYRLLEAGESSGVWDFEEGHCGHAVKS